MNTSSVISNTDVDAFSRAVVARLSQSSDALPHEITERLRAARMQALSRRKQKVVQFAPVWSLQGSSATLQSGEDDGGFWRKVAVFLPLIALLAFLPIHCRSGTTTNLRWNIITLPRPLLSS